MAKQNALTSLLNEGEIKPSQRRSLSAETADKLRELILLEKLPPGMHIPERDLADVLGISRTPMREALRILESEGLVDHTPTRRSRVANPSPEELAQSMKVLGTLEALGGELACTHASESDIEAISALNSRMHEQSDMLSSIDFFKTDMDFHASIIAAGGNAALVDTHAKYNARLWRARFLSSRRKLGRATTLQQHQDITNAIRNRDAGVAADAMRAHIETAIENLFIDSDEQESFE
ncbi:MAG: GntR family transcriptional regulator [Pseudomonadota bacterium]|nr:GntR family transcriptional regulator [Pseudomonadota bacterium]